MKKEMNIMTKFKINLTEAPDKMRHGCYLGRPDDYSGFEEELRTLVQLLNLNIEGIFCEEYNNKSIVIESEISTTGELLERIKPEFTSRFCYINYDDKNPITIIYD